MKGLVFASFGTTYADAREKHIDSVAKVMDEAFDDFTVVQCYTSSMVRRILEKRGLHVPDVKEALQNLANEGVSEVLVATGLLLPGEEYEKLCSQAKECSHLFSSLTIGQPLLASTADIHALADIVSAVHPVQPKTAIILMGHGTPQFANTIYAALDYRLKDIGRGDVYIGTVEAYPELDSILRLMEGKGYEKAILAPLMQVAGDHAINDMAGEEEDSWASILKSQGLEVESRLIGLGELPAIQEMYLSHAQKALSSED